MRVFAVAESFGKPASKSSLAGVVMRRDLVIDGLVFGSATIAGDDSTDQILSMYFSLQRDDVNCIMLDGLVISMYNIIDGRRLSEKTGLAVIAITFEDSMGLEGAIRHHFPETWEKKLSAYKELGARQRITLKTGKNLYIRCWGVDIKQATFLLDSFTLQGAVPEPIRVAKMAARCANALN